MRGEERFAQRERAILDAAHTLLRTGGFAGTSMEDVARACGVGKATLYKHFPSKEELVVAVLVESLARADEALRAMPSDRPALERLRWLLLGRVEHRVRHAPLVSGQIPPAVARHPRVLAHEARLHDRVVRLVDEARRHGEIGIDAPTAVIAGHLSATFGPELDLTAERLGLEPEVLARHLAALVLDGLRAR